VSESIYDIRPIEEEGLTEGGAKKVEEKTMPPLEVKPELNRLNSGQRRRNSRERNARDAASSIEREQIALDKLESRDFLDVVFPRFYKNKYDEDVSELSDLEKVHLFYEDRIGNYHNTGKAITEVYGVTMGDLSKDNEYRADWAEMTQLYEDLPDFGQGGIGVWKWIKHFLPEMTIKDPTFYISLGLGKLATSSGKNKAITEAVEVVKKKIAKDKIEKTKGKEALENISDEDLAKYFDNNELARQMTLNSAKAAAAFDGLIGVGVGVAHDMHAQESEIEAGLSNEFSTWRMIKSGTLTGSISALTSGIFTGYSLKGANSKYYKDKETGFLRDVNRELRDLDIENNVSYQVNAKGELKTFKPKKGGKKKTAATTKKEIEKPDESDLIIQKSKEFSRTTDILNYEKIKGSDDFKLEIKNIMDSLGKNGVIRTEIRKALLKKAKDRGIELQTKDTDRVFEMLEHLSKMGDEGAALKFAADLEVLGRIQQFVKLRDLIEEAVTPKEKAALAKEMEDVFLDIAEKSKISTGAGTAASDIVQSGKLTRDLNEVEKLMLQKAELMTEAVNAFKRGFADMSVEQRIETLAKMGEHMNNPYKLQQLIDDANIRANKNQVTFGQALNEVVTGSLLLDISTHIINMSSAGIKTSHMRLEDYLAGIIHLGKTGDIELLRMLNDVNMQNRFVYVSALKDAMLAFKLQRSIGDQFEHKFDQPRLFMANQYVKQSEASGNALEKLLTSPYISINSKFSNFAFKSLGFEDTFIKNLVNRAYRIAHVNHRMRKFYPELWGKKPKDVTKALVEEQQIRHLRREINYQLSLDKVDKAKVQKMEDEILELEAKIDTGEFATKYRELFYQYEDEFGNFRMTKDFDESEISSLDELTKSVAYDPTYVGRESNFTNNPKREIFEPNQFYPEQTRNQYDIGGRFIKFANQWGWGRYLTGLHFMKTPNNLIKEFAIRTPVLNMVVSDWWKMMRAEDPIIRTKAHSQSSLGLITTLAAYHYFDDENFTGGDHPDISKRYTFRFTDENGDKQIVNIGKYIQFAPHLELAQDIKLWQKKVKEIELDPMYSADMALATAKMNEFFSAQLAYYNHRISNQMYMREFANLVNILMNPDSSIVSKLEQYGSNLASKTVPAVTLNRSTNRALAEARYEIDTFRKKMIDSTPYELIKYVNEELLDNAFEKPYYADMVAPKRDMFHNPYPPRNIIHAVPMDRGLSALMYDRSGNKLNLSESGKSKLLDAAVTSNYNGMADSYKLKGLGKEAPNLELRKYEIESFAMEDGKNHSFYKKLEMPEKTSLYEGMKIVAKNIIHDRYDDRTLNETIAYEIDNPTSTFNTLYRQNRLLGGEYEGGAYLRQILNDYNEAARDHMKEHFKFKIGGKVKTILELEEEVDEGLTTLIRED
tara:strand:- start:2834 stop:7018 length:4185 start_codon:yes stop_codon:yes gene_type:complete